MHGATFPGGTLEESYVQAISTGPFQCGRVNSFLPILTALSLFNHYPEFMTIAEVGTDWSVNWQLCFYALLFSPQQVSTESAALLTLRLTESFAPWPPQTPPTPYFFAAATTRATLLAWQYLVISGVLQANQAQYNCSARWIPSPRMSTQCFGNHHQCRHQPPWSHSLVQLPQGWRCGTLSIRIRCHQTLLYSFEVLHVLTDVQFNSILFI